MSRLHFFLLSASHSASYTKLAVVIVLLLWLATQLADTGLFFYLTLILMKETQVNLFLKKKKYFSFLYLKKILCNAS